MRYHQTAIVVDLAYHKLLELDDAEGELIEAIEGILWITQDADPRDVILEPGQSFTVDRPGLTLVSALSDARLRVSRVSASRPEFAAAA